MTRLFQTNEHREVHSLDGSWDFAIIGEGEPNLGRLSYSNTLIVPGCWEMHPDFLTYRGRGAYRKRISLKKKTSLRFVFKGVSHTAHVYLDGQILAEHYNAYTAFDAIAIDVEPGDHELTVIADNRFGPDSALHIPNDYYTYGGINRPVAMEQLDELYIERIAFTPIWENGKWKARIQGFVRHLREGGHPYRLQIELCGRKLQLDICSPIEAGITRMEGTFDFNEAEAWSQESPVLYELKSQLVVDDAVVDDLIERVGFRVVTTEKGKIQLNGKDIVFKGVNRHEDHPMVGSALPLQLMALDADLITNMGCNSVRTSHYPNDERFLDLCDERGILVWEENHARGLSLSQMQNPNFHWQCKQVNREMVEQHYNHPSIVIWAILNECASNTPEGREMYKEQLEQIRGLDASRPLTFASHHRDKELCFDLADIVSFNLYPGWYGDEDPGELCDLARDWADASGGSGKPMIMSEFGGDGYYGHRDASRVRGTEERQSDIIEANLSAYTSRGHISGMFIWQYCDCRVTEGTDWLITRAGTQNSKGIVDRYRRPKLAYATVQKYFNREME
ncbi:beta-glucuronidase [Paenibacillus endophyticus]|uniref:Beta-glucuronidase n=1 Tax=Paenibacillus endophyticus TaxID=1294268 RepID=A0A7W5C640_9BACL|nr:glycoside hydrolase family 2 TIM barrel-domain containing protein [Paenibacillus endophyticus]MBB3151394.1 beta-glucuronidase [Paenibacillus endophyticus]